LYIRCIITGCDLRMGCVIGCLAADRDFFKSPQRSRCNW